MLQQIPEENLGPLNSSIVSYLLSLDFFVKKFVRQNLPKTTAEKEAWCWSLYIPAGQRHHSTCICLWADLCGGGTVHKECKVIYNREFKRRGKKSLFVALPTFTHRTLPSLISIQKYHVSDEHSGKESVQLLPVIPDLRTM